MHRYRLWKRLNFYLGACLLQDNHKVIEKKDVKIKGIDIDEDYVHSF